MKEVRYTEMEKRVEMRPVTESFSVEKSLFKTIMRTQTTTQEVTEMRNKTFFKPETKCEQIGESTECKTVQTPQQR